MHGRVVLNQAGQVPSEDMHPTATKLSRQADHMLDRVGCNVPQRGHGLVLRETHGDDRMDSGSDKPGVVLGSASNRLPLRAYLFPRGMCNLGQHSVRATGTCEDYARPSMR